MRRALRGSTVVGVVAILAGCAVAPVGNGPPPDGVTVEFVQLRSDVAARQAQVQVRNDTDEAIEIGAVHVADARFEGDAMRVIEGRTTSVAPGGTTDIRIQLPPMNCDVTEGSMSVLLELDDHAVEAPLPDALDVIAPLHERECLAAQVRDAASLAFTSFEPSPAGEPATLVLSVEPTGEGSAEVIGIQTTNLLTFAAAAGMTADTYPLELEITPTSDAIGIALPLVPLRCDPHAVQEDKRGTVFTLEVALDGVPGEIELAASEEMRGQMLTWVADWCGFGG
ncbi:hypothetical protein GCM10009775_14620 [Microbacterium aoyamense]|uniref:Lipoprotein n=1 Tax=Microbacterium aoyamense TaxID=344166 RepID=A0ABN2PJ72_9MICO|nr:hypothetical protein [Microbacterium aoyamense]